MEGIRQVWTLISAFFQLLPAEVVMCASFAFVGCVVIGLLGWFK